MKIQSRCCLRRVSQESIHPKIGVLSHKVADFTRCDHIALGPQLFVYQLIKAIDQIRSLLSADFPDKSESDMILSSRHRPHKVVIPSVSCELFFKVTVHVSELTWHSYFFEGSVLAEMAVAFRS